MRKEVKKGKTCTKCKSELSPAIFDYFCDECNKKLPDEKTGDYQISVYKKNYGREGYMPTDDDTLEFCCWKCARQFMIKFPNKYKLKDLEFIDLPFINKVKGKSFKSLYEEFMRDFLNFKKEKK